MSDTLQSLLDAFNAHDLDAIMSFLTDDCVFDTPRFSRKDSYWKITS